MSIAEMIARNFERESDRVAVSWQGQTFTFQDLHQKTCYWRRFLDQAGILAEERVALILPNSINLVVLHAGNLLGGRTTVPINPRQSASEMAKILKDCQPKLVVVSEDARDNLEEALRLAEISPLVLAESLIRSSLSGGARSPVAQTPNIQNDQAAMIVYTSGTTGQPKGAVLTQGNLEAAAISLIEAWALGPHDRVLLTLPLFHVHGLGVGIHSMLTSGLEVILEASFDAPHVCDLLASEELGITLFFGVPTYYHRLLGVELRGKRFDHLRICISGSAPLSEATHQVFFEKFNQRILERYGMTETMMNLSNPLAGTRIPGYVGQPLPRVQIRIADPQGSNVPHGSEGQILIKGPHVTPRYWQAPEATIAAFDQDGWFRSGDLGRYDPELDSYQITGRLKELIISGGMNIHPQEVENVIAEVLAVEAVGVAGIPHADLGEIVGAFVVGAPHLTLDELRHACQGRLSAYKIPRVLYHREELPVNALGKLLRAQLGGEA